MNPEDLLIGEGGESTITVVKEFLGVQREAYVCPDCDEACTETYVHDPQRAAFDDGASPAWECPECRQQYVWETSDSSHTLDLYGRGME